MKAFNFRLSDRIYATGSHLCVGLDIRPETGKKPSSLNDLKAHTRRVIDATHDLAAAYKPNLAFFERWGSEGWRWLEETLEFIPDDQIVIADAKRGDIGNTAEQYATGLFDHYGFDAVTVNPYMGSDSIRPFLKRPDKGAFILCRTSNPSALELQDATSGDLPLYGRVARLAMDLNQENNVGLVVGATAPGELGQIRSWAPGLPVLIPGVGAQGGDLETSFRTGNSNGVALISISRGICFSGDLSIRAIRSSALKYRDEMREFGDEQ